MPDGLYISGAQPRSGKPAYLQYDSLDDRKEIFYLLEKLPPALRVQFLAWCCRRCYMPNTRINPVVSKERTRGTALEIFYDIWVCAAQYSLNMDLVTTKLVEVVRSLK